MISFKSGSAVHVSQFQGEWNPDCHWIVQPGEPVEATFVQEVLDKYAAEIAAYAISEFGSGYCIELQFHDQEVGRKCNQEYCRGWRKGGKVSKALKAANKPATKRLYQNRMYILPDGTEFFYYAMWDGHGNLIGKVLTETGLVADDEGNLPLENRVVHRSVVEKGEIVAIGEERFVLGKRKEFEATARQKQIVHNTVCRLRSKNGIYGPGDLVNSEEIQQVCAAVQMPQYKVWSALEQLEADGIVYLEGDSIWITEKGWRTWPKWKDEFLLDIVFCVSGEDWPEWEEREYWKDIKRSVWEALEAEYVRLRKEEDNNEESSAK